MFELAGMPVILDEAMSDRVQFRFPRTKNRRIRKKWTKRQQNWRQVPRQIAVRLGNTFYMHPAIWAELCRDHGVRIEPDARGMLQARR